MDPHCLWIERLFQSRSRPRQAPIMLMPLFISRPFRWTSHKQRSQAHRRTIQFFVLAPQVQNLNKRWIANYWKTGSTVLSRDATICRLIRQKYQHICVELQHLHRHVLAAIKLCISICLSDTCCPRAAEGQVAHLVLILHPEKQSPVHRAWWLHQCAELKVVWRFAVKICMHSTLAGLKDGGRWDKPPGLLKCAALLHIYVKPHSITHRLLMKVKPHQRNRKPILF